MLEDVPIVVIEPGALFREGLRHIVLSQGCDLVWCSDVPPPAASGPVDLAPVVCVVGGPVDAAIAHVADLRAIYPAGRCVLLVDEITTRQWAAAVQAGVVAAILKQSSSASLLASLRLVCESVSVVPAHLMAADPRPLDPLPAFIEGALAPPKLAPPIGAAPGQAHFPHLSAREQSVLNYLSQGMSNKEIARALQIADATVKVHVKALLRKSRTRNRTEAATLALRGTIRIGEQCDGALSDRPDVDRLFLARPVSVA